MNANDYTMDPRNAVAVQFLQSRPIQIGASGFLISVAQDLERRGLSKGQREAVERIAAKSRWEPKDPLPPSVDDRGDCVLVYVTPGCHPGNDFMEALAARYIPLGKTGVRVVHDPVYMALLDPGNVQDGTPHLLLTSCGCFRITGTGWAFPGLPKPRHAESADTLNDVVSPQLSTADSVFEFRNVKVKSGWWVFGERRSSATSVSVKCA